ncbi:MAG: penicillin-binding protein 1C [Maricaulis sp.]|jgi:penicillin-binding protein 1C
MLGLGRIYWVVAGTLAGLVFLLALDALLPVPLEPAQARSQLVRDRDGELLRAFPVADGRWRLAADLDRIDPDFIDALLAYEDSRFYSHIGVDPGAVVRAAWEGLRAGRIVSGASTLSMQVARLLEPRPRTYGAKFLQMTRALQLELHLSKREILELYLTLAPYGGNLEGVRAASWAYFGREPDQLTIEQIALLIALPQSPEARRPDRHPEAAIAARGRVLDRLARVGLARPTAQADAALDPAPGRRAFPGDAWQVAETLARHNRGRTDMVTTLDAGLQRALEQQVRDNLPMGDDEAQIAVMVVETQSRAVRAAIGSAGRERPGGWIDLTTRPRSPGSTLKPFIYAMAFDDGLAAPDTRIADLPRRFAGYQPDNFDRRFRGDVTITEALQHSLNIPAVTALDDVGARRFSAALGFAGAQPERPHGAARDDGLAVALGGAGLSVQQLAILYAALGDGGRARPLRWFEDEDQVEDGSGFALVSAESAHEILTILRRAPHPGGRMPAILTTQAPEIAFKTGTSYGFRDAWSAGVAGGYTVVVWVGRADGVPRDGVTGRDGALPLLFRVFDMIESLEPSQAQPGRDESEMPESPVTMAQFQLDPAPQILFPPDGSEVWAERRGRGFVLAAQGQSAVNWYADGVPVGRNAVGDAVWYPGGPGFYVVEVVDQAGRRSRARVRIRMES